MRRWAIAIGWLAAAGCGGALPGKCEDGSCGTQTWWRKTYQATVNRKVDLLFVVDDTSAIAPQAGALAAALPDIAERLRVPWGPSSLHVGFVRAGACDTSTRAQACGVAPEPFARSEWCHTITNFSGGFSDTLNCLADLGTSDCGPAQPLAAAVRALAEPPQAGTEGFLRPDAYLMIVIVAAADDASGPAGAPTPPVEIATALKALKADPSQVLVSIAGPGDCAAGDVPGPRLVEFVNQFGANGLYLGLCSGQLPVLFDRVTSTVNSSLQPPCAQNVRDTDPDTAGLQADCNVEEMAKRPDGSYLTSQLPSCEQAAPPCWRFHPGAAGCNGYVFEVERGADWCSEAGVWGQIECLSCADASDPACRPVP